MTLRAASSTGTPACSTATRTTVSTTSTATTPRRSPGVCSSSRSRWSRCAIAGRLGVGIAASTGNEKGSASNPWLNPFKSPGQQTIFQYLTSTPANTVFAKGRHTRINPQLYYYIGPFGLLAEWVKEYQELANSVGSGAVNNNAAHVTASFVIGGAATYEGIKPNHPLSVADGTFGAIEIALRYEYLHIDTDAFPTAADPSVSVRKAQSGGVALNWQLNRNIKVSADYFESWFEGGAEERQPPEREGLASAGSRSTSEPRKGDSHVRNNEENRFDGGGGCSPPVR